MAEKKKEINLTIEVDLDHIYEILEGLQLLSIMNATDRHRGYIYSKMFIQIQQKFHMAGLCESPEGECPYDESVKKFNSFFKEEIEADFNRLIKMKHQSTNPKGRKKKQDVSALQQTSPLQDTGSEGEEIPS